MSKKAAFSRVTATGSVGAAEWRVWAGIERSGIQEWQRSW